MDQHGASEAESEVKAGTSFYFEEEICLKVSPSVGRRSAVDQGKGCHMRFAEYAIRILALLQEDGMGKGKTSTGSHRFATLCAVVLPLLSLPNSNADSENVFSMVKNTDTDSRSDRTQYVLCSAAS